MHPRLLLLITVSMLMLGGCASRPVDPLFLTEAEDALELAVASGAQTHAPLELGEARDLLEQARAAVGEGEAGRAADLVERVILQARLALIRTQAAITRAELEQQRQAYEQLFDELRQAYGPAIEEPR
ncbi:MAG: hypothetical protein Kow0020_08660 [Wenzhouxiangellaceae bacterium]